MPALRRLVQGCQAPLGAVVAARLKHRSAEADVLEPAVKFGVMRHEICAAHHEVAAEAWAAGQRATSPMPPPPSSRRCLRSASSGGAWLGGRALDLSGIKAVALVSGTLVALPLAAPHSAVLIAGDSRRQQPHDAEPAVAQTCPAGWFRRSARRCLARATDGEHNAERDCCHRERCGDAPAVPAARADEHPRNGRPDC